MVTPTPVRLTPWFPHTVKPVREGFYEVGHSTYIHHLSKYRLTPGRRYWDGKHWKGGWFWVTPSIFGTHPTHQWRGIMK